MLYRGWCGRGASRSLTICLAHDRRDGTNTLLTLPSMAGQCQLTSIWRWLHLSKSTKRKAARVVRRKLADGTVKEYRYSPHKKLAPKEAPDSISALVKAYLASQNWDSLKESTRRTYAIYLRELEEIGSAPAASVKRRAIHAIHDSLSRHRGNGAATGFLRASGAFFSWAVDREWIEHSPVHRIKAKPGGHLPAWSREQADLAQRLLPEHFRRVVILARYTGQRRGDLIALTWRAYDGQTIELVQQKTGEPLTIPCPEPLRTELDRWQANRDPSVTILTNTYGRPWTAPHLSRELPKALAKVGMSDDLNVHGLRKLAAAELADAGCSTHEIAAITGHRTLSMVALYTRSADQKRLAKAAVVRLSEARDAMKRQTNARKM